MKNLTGWMRSSLISMRHSPWFIGSACLLIGATIGVFLSNWQYFVFEKAIGFFDLFSLIVTTSVGVYLAIVIGKGFNKQNSEKALLIAEVKESILLVESINAEVDKRSYNLHKMIADIKTLNEDLYLLERLLENSHCRKIKTSHIRKVLLNFRNQATGISPTPDSNSAINVNTNQYVTISALGRNMKERYFILAFEINQE